MEPTARGIHGARPAMRNEDEGDECEPGYAKDERFESNEPWISRLARPILPEWPKRRSSNPRR